MKLWAMPCRAAQDIQVIVESSDKMWSTGGGNGKVTIPVFLWEPHEQCDKAKRYDIGRWAPHVKKCPVAYWGRAEDNY